MTSTSASVVARAGERARAEPEFARVLAALVEAPMTPEGELASEAAKALNRGRREQATTAFTAGALSTSQVQELLGLGTPQAVHARHARGKLLGLQVGNSTWFPAWQFDLDDQRARPDLPRILDLLGRFTSDALAADRVMRLERSELGGSIAEALRHDDDRARHAWNILAGLGS